MSNFKFKVNDRTCTVSGTAKTTPIMKFKDFRGIDCSIRVADTGENTILLGHEQADIKRLIVGEGMQPVHIQEPYIINTQMSLNSPMAADLAQVLQAFVGACQEESVFQDDDETTLILPLTTAPKQMALAVRQAPDEPLASRHPEISEYINGLSQLYSHCYQTASRQLENTPLAPQDVKDVAASLFTQTIRHFDLPPFN